MADDTLDNQDFGADPNPYDSPPVTGRLVAIFETLLREHATVDSFVEMFEALESDWQSLGELIRTAEEQGRKSDKEKFQRLGIEYKNRIESVQRAKRIWRGGFEEDPDSLEEAWNHFKDHLRGLLAWLRDIKLPAQLWTGGLSHETDLQPGVTQTLQIGVEAERGPSREQTKPPTMTDSTGATPRRSWRQQELDEAIRQYRNENVKMYANLVKEIAEGNAGAQSAARKLYGRNAIGRKFKCKSTAMVSKSIVWKAMKAELRLGRQTRTDEHRLEAPRHSSAAERANPTFEGAAFNELVSAIKQSMPRDRAEATIERVRTGDLTAEKAMELVATYLTEHSQWPPNRKA